MTEQHALFDPLLQDLSDRSRDEVLATFSAVQYAAHPVPEAQLAGLLDTQADAVVTAYRAEGIEVVERPEGEWCVLVLKTT